MNRPQQLKPLKREVIESIYTTTLTITTLQRTTPQRWPLQHHNADHYNITTSNTRVTGQVEASIMMKASYTVSRISTSDTYFLFQLSDIGLVDFWFIFWYIFLFQLSDIGLAHQDGQDGVQTVQKDHQTRVHDH